MAEVSGEVIKIVTAPYICLKFHFFFVTPRFILIVYHTGILSAEMIEELIGRGQQVDAVHFTYEVGLADKFPPVPLLKAFLKDAKKAAAAILEDSYNFGRAAVSSHSFSPVIYISSSCCAFFQIVSVSTIAVTGYGCLSLSSILSLPTVLLGSAMISFTFFGKIFGFQLCQVLHTS